MVLVKMVTKESKEDTTIEDGWVVVGLDSMKISRGFTFQTMPLTNPIFISNFKRKRKAQTYIRVHRRTFRYSADSEVIWWLESKSCAYTYGRINCCQQN